MFKVATETERIEGERERETLWRGSHAFHPLKLPAISVSLSSKEVAIILS
jgi:hypothetical protein